MDLPLPVAALLALATALLGTLGGIGGAVVLVPVLVLLGVDARIAAALGILSVASGSLAAAPGQLRAGLVHHRLGVVLEIAASAGAVVGAFVSGAISPTLLSRLLAVVAIVAAVAGGRRKGLRNPPHHVFAAEPAGEWPGTLAGAYHIDARAAPLPGADVTSDTGTGSPDDPDADDLRRAALDHEPADTLVVPYQARNVGPGLVAMVGAGLVAGIAGVGGGFIKTPTMSEVMKVPVKVAAATTTFTVGVTSAASLIVFAGQGRIDAEAGAAVVVGSLVGGTTGAWLAKRLAPTMTRRVLTVALAGVGVILLVRG